MPVVPFIPAIIGAGASIWGAHEAASATSDAAKTSSEAATKAAEIQAQTANRALDIQDQQFKARLANLAPYRQQGAGALGQLNSLMGLPPIPASAPAASTGMGAVYKPLGAPVGAGTMLPNQPPMIPGQGAQVPSPTSSAFLGMTAPPGSPNVQGNVGLVTVQAPDGRRVQVPQAQLAVALQNGGQVING